MTSLVIWSFFSEGCGIPDGDSIILTGGARTENRASRYTVNGWLENLPDLKIGRTNHGCASYTAEDGSKVRSPFQTY